MYIYPILTPPCAPAYNYSPQKVILIQCSCSSALCSCKNGIPIHLAFQGLKGSRKIPRGHGELVVIFLIHSSTVQEFAAL